MTKYPKVFVVASFAALLAVFTFAPVARADIFQWEYINPANPSLGKQQSTIVCPGGRFVDAAPNANLTGRDLTMAYLIGTNLTGSYFYSATLTNADLSQSNLANAYFGYFTNGSAILTGANFTGAQIRGASFWDNITTAQLYSTASYQSHDLTGIRFEYNNLSGWNFAGQNLTNAGFSSATLTGVNLAGAEVRGAGFESTTSRGFTADQLYSTASYQNHDLSGIHFAYDNLAGWNFAGQNLTSVNFYSATLTGVNLAGQNLTNVNFNAAALTGVNLAGAEVRGAGFESTTSRGFTAAQLYSTASYQNHDLTGIALRDNNLAGWNFVGQKLTGGGFYFANMTGANLSRANLANGYLYYAIMAGANLSQASLNNAYFEHATLTSADLSQANLTDAHFGDADLTGANLNGAEVRGARFGNTTSRGFTAAQLYSTASYQNHDLTGISFYYDNLSGWNFAGQNLTNASFDSATLTGVNLTGAQVRGAGFETSGFTAAQLYSTASYQNHDLTGIRLGPNNLSGWNLAGQNLTDASFYFAFLNGANLSRANLSNAYFYHATLTAADLSQSKLINADFSGTSTPVYDEWGQYLYDEIDPGADLSSANLSGADARGANFYLATISGANTSNLIKSNGHIAGLELTSGESLTIRNYHGAAAPKVVIDQHLAMDASGTLRLEFDADPWDSTISFAPGIPAARGGTLELTFAPNVNLASQIGRTIDLFDWTGVTPISAFTVSGPYTWDLSKLYTTGEVTLAALAAIPGDFNNNGVVDAADYIVWRKTDGTPSGYNAWRTHFGQTAGSGAALPSAEPLSAAVPEPAASALVCIGFLLSVFFRQRAVVS